MTNPVSSSEPTRFPTFSWVYHGLFSWRTLGRVMVVIGALATLVVLFYVEENVRGKHAWNQYRQQLEAKGVKLDYWAFVPPPVPDDQNFAMTPFLAPLFDFNPKPLELGQSLWRDTNGFKRANDFAKELNVGGSSGWIRWQFTDFQDSIAKTRLMASAAKKASTRAESAGEVMQILKKYDNVLDELRTASHRPHARFNVQYTNDFAPATLLPHLNVATRVASVFQLRASAELALNQTDAACSDARMALYLTETLKDEPFLISQLVRHSMVQRSLQPIWEGLAEHKWSEAQLVEMGHQLGQITLFTPRPLQAELAYAILTMDQMRAQSEKEWGESASFFSDIAVPHFLVPDGWFYMNQLSFAHSYEDLVLPVIGESQRIHPDKAIANELILKQKYSDGFSPNRFLAKRFFLGDKGDIALFEAMRKYAFGQTHVNEAVVACALERYRRANGQFPEKLIDITPKYLGRIPSDLITGEPLKYRRTADGQFVLYSVGWNEKDDGGTVAMTDGKTPTVDATRGDWVWQYPAK